MYRMRVGQSGDCGETSVCGTREVDLGQMDVSGGCGLVNRLSTLIPGCSTDHRTVHLVTVDIDPNEYL